MPGGGGATEALEQLSREEVREVLVRAGFGNEAWLDDDLVGGEGGFGTVIMVGLFSALGGGLFGLDIGYISGVESMKSFCDDLLGGKPMEDVNEGLVTGVFALGAVLAAFPSILSFVVDALGRTGAINLGGLVFCLGALLQSLSPNLTVMFVGRLIAGGAVGLLSANIPIFQGEIAPPTARGSIVSLYQLAITMGIMVAFWTNYGLQTSVHGWRYSIGLQLIPGLLLFAGGFFMPGSPRWLVSKGRTQEAFETLRRIRGPSEDVRSELASICREHEKEAAAGKSSWKEFCSGTNGKLLVIGILLQVIQQMCGLNLFMYYGPVVFKMVFQSPRASFLFSAFSGIVNFFSTFPAIFLADRAGRMVLLRWSAAGMMLSCVVLALVGSNCFTMPKLDTCEVPKEGECGFIPGKNYTASMPPGCGSGQLGLCGEWSKWVAAGSIFFFTFNFAYGWGPVVWIYCAEMFPSKFRTRANGLTTDANWVGNFFIGFLPPMMFSNLGFNTFWIFAAINGMGLIMSCSLPETKGRSLEDIQLMFDSWFNQVACYDAADDELLDTEESDDESGSVSSDRSGGTSGPDARWRWWPPTPPSNTHLLAGQ